MNEGFDTQNKNAEAPATKTSELPGLGLAVACLVLGIVAVSLSLLLIGGICGLIGLVLAIVHLSKRYPLRSLAWWGLGLSIVGVLGTAAMAIYIIGEVGDVWDTMSLMEAQSFDEWIGKEAPDFTVKDLKGNSITLSNFKGKRVMLDFWATWCPPCRMEIPHFVKLRNRYDPSDLVVIGISDEKVETIRAFTEKRRINYTLAIGKNLPSPYGDITSIPTTFFIDRNGVIRCVVDGYHSFKELNALVVALDHRHDPNEPQDIPAKGSQ